MESLRCALWLLWGVPLFSEVAARAWSAGEFGALAAGPGWLRSASGALGPAAPGAINYLLIGCSWAGPPSLPHNRGLR